MNQELSNTLNRHKDEFKHLEKERAKYLVNLQYVEQKIKNLNDKLEKVKERHSLLEVKTVSSHTFSLQLQDSSKIDDREKDCKNSTNQIPKLEENIPQLQKLLLLEEKVLEEIVENSKGCIFAISITFRIFILLDSFTLIIKERFFKIVLGCT